MATDASGGQFFAVKKLRLKGNGATWSINVYMSYRIAEQFARWKFNRFRSRVFEKSGGKKDRNIFIRFLITFSFTSFFTSREPFAREIKSHRVRYVVVYRTNASDHEYNTTSLIYIYVNIIAVQGWFFVFAWRPRKCRDIFPVLKSHRVTIIVIL